MGALKLMAATESAVVVARASMHFSLRKAVLSCIRAFVVFCNVTQPLEILAPETAVKGSSSRGPQFIETCGQTSPVVLMACGIGD